MSSSNLPIDPSDHLLTNAITCDGSGAGRVCVASILLDILYVKKSDALKSDDGHSAEYSAVAEADRIRKESGNQEVPIFNDYLGAVDAATRHHGIRNVFWIPKEKGI